MSIKHGLVTAVVVLVVLWIVGHNSTLSNFLGL
jgi:uncharacterized membrane protein YdbT with pleckstrin-like domain